jgi:hypothetical protein
VTLPARSSASARPRTGPLSASLSREAVTVQLTRSLGKLVETEKEINVFYGHLIGAVLMIAAGIAEWFIGVEAPAGRLRTSPGR